MGDGVRMDRAGRVFCSHTAHAGIIWIAEQREVLRACAQRDIDLLCPRIKGRIKGGEIE